MNLLYIVCYKGKPLSAPISKLEASDMLLKWSRSFSNLEIVEVKEEAAAANQ
ncbi:hypothetical protein [Paenibacillus hexagrammi]|uniref:Uncharacterized protein n=1 Tax=Paenibacillus hexagrammi TaxID=2908839 RepID=A0ABY3SR49_9BACL|nr:hypothetical protein [Paenibacillus sp. YPD9-1]UJF35880.1 hypothetical protein L0M14_12830 [Paenibacillus sp. YPD9-1]